MEVIDQIYGVHVLMIVGKHVFFEIGAGQHHVETLPESHIQQRMRWKDMDVTKILSRHRDMWLF